MSDISVSVQQITRSGLDYTATGSLSLANTYQAKNNGDTFLYVVNGGGSSDTVTVISSKTIAGLAVADLTVAVGAGADKFIGPFPPDIFNNADGEIEWTHSFITSVTHAALKVG